MPYARGYKKQNGFGKQPWKNGKAKANTQWRKNTAANYRRQAMSMANPRTGGYTGIELKFLDTALAANALTAPTDSTGGEQNPSLGSTGCISAMAQGDGESQRDGRRVVLKSVNIKGVIRCDPQINQTAGDTSTECIVALVWDSQSNGVTLNSENVFANPSATSQGAPLVFRNLQFQERFKVLATKHITFSQPNMVWDGTNIEQGGTQRSFSFYKSLNLPVTHTGTTANISAVSDNSLHVVAFCSNVSLVPDLSYNSRVRFVG